MYQLLNCFIVFYLITWRPCRSQYVTNTATKMIGKIRVLATEMVMDALSKIDVVEAFRHIYAKNTAFQMGDVVYKIRYKYKRMIFLYNLALSRIDEQNHDPEAHVDKLIEVDDLAHEIDNLLRMIELYEEKRGRKFDMRVRSLRSNDAETWQRLADTQQYDQNFDPPSETQNNSSRRKNGLWSSAFLDDYDNK